MLIGGVYFPEPLLSALRNGEVVIFAGAGVSMGDPANLPKFDDLAEQIALGTGHTYDRDKESADRFLGRLRYAGVEVNTLAARILQKNNPMPTDLHRDLLRIYRRSEDVLIVTTNFDLLFERAASEVFNRQPKIYTAPALPVGNTFRGIVHLHGSLDEPDEMVITHQDFGSAYLTQADGWARRFLVDLFTSRTVLFVGYSHNDTMMTYFTPSLSPDSGRRRFALIGKKIDDVNRWSIMGIEPVPFPQEYNSDFTGLDAAVGDLADRMQRGVLAWRNYITEIGRKLPPKDDESIGIINNALSTSEHARFFAAAADSPDWVDWLDQQGLLARLFDQGLLEEADGILCWWLARRFTTTHADELFSLIQRHEGRLNPVLWKRFALQLIPDETKLDAETLSKWMHFLMSSVPSDISDIDDFVLVGLAQRCVELGLYQNLLQVYDAMTMFRNQVRPGFERDTRGVREHQMRTLREKCIEPHLPAIALPLLERTTMRLEERRSAILAWNGGNGAQDTDSSSRLSINPKSRERMPREIDYLIDLARICLEWLATEKPEIVKLWVERHANSGAPLLRRLAIHAMSSRDNICADEKLSWLVGSCDINDISSRNEISEFVAAAYPLAGDKQRSALIQGVSEYRAPESEHYDSNVRSAYYHFAWFSRLRAFDPNCNLAKKALQDITADHPEFSESEYTDAADLRIHTGFFKSPWTKEELLAKTGHEWLPDLLSYRPRDQEKLDGVFARSPTLGMMREAAITEPRWGMDLAAAMVANNEWDNDLWPHLLSAWMGINFEADDLYTVLNHLANGELQTRETSLVADVLVHMVQRVGASDSSRFLAEANPIAATLLEYVEEDTGPDTEVYLDGKPQYVRWLDRANNHLSGKLAWYWVYSIVRWRREQPHPTASVPDEYRTALDSILYDDRATGKFVRTVLASQLDLLLTVDAKWTEKNLLPLFDTAHQDFDCAWEGFLDWGRMTPIVDEHLRTALPNALPQIISAFDGRLIMPFVGCYIDALCTSIVSANDERITTFFQHANDEAKYFFAGEIGYRLRGLDETAQKEWWDVWLQDYWENRMRGVPSPLNDDEIERMLEWVPILSGVFPQAVGVAIQMRKAPLKRGWMFPEVVENSLGQQYPSELARFLIHLGRCETEPLLWLGTNSVFGELLGADLPGELEYGIRELDAKYNFEE